MSTNRLASRLAPLLRDLSPSCGGTAVVAIDGRAGSGKSTLGTALAQELNCPIARMETVYPGWDGLEQGIDLMAHRVMRPLSLGESALVPQWDWHTMTWGADHALDPPTLLVVEGVGCGARPMSPYLALLVWLECEPDVRRARALSRAEDGAAFATEWERWAQQEDDLLRGDPIPLRADVTLRTDSPDDIHP